MKRTLLVIAGLSLLAQGEEEKVIRGHVFAWPFTETAEMQPRGGTTKGAEVELEPGFSGEWKRLQEKTESKYARDTHAILALAGSYRVSFDFIETMGFTKDYEPRKPYFSWGTEHVKVLEVKGDFISLQHTLVMYFKDKDGQESGPMVMKHWRQDWRYQDTSLHTYRGNSTWARETREADSMQGKWTQAVYQVDDSPRYEVVGEWDHSGGMSTWRSESCWRPLPRREFSVRDDYNVLQGTHEITITPNGWVHLQNNQKVSLGEKGAVTILAQELGVNRYERIKEPSLTAAEETWKKTGDYWKQVRLMWDEVYRDNDTFSLKSEVEEKRLYQYHFGYAMQLEGSDEAYDEAKGRAHARGTIAKFLQTDSSGKDGRY